MLIVTQIKNLKTGILTDAGPYRGLRMQASSAGKSWFYRYRNREGKNRQLKLGMFPFMSLAEAREKVVEYQQMIGVCLTRKICRGEEASNKPWEV
jgi:hypothetical protein